MLQKEMDEAPPAATQSEAASGLLPLLERGSQAAAAISGFAIVASLFYNWAYFQVAAPSALQLLTVADQVSGALKWLPGAVIAYGCGAPLYALLSGRYALLLDRRKRRPPVSVTDLQNSITDLQKDLRWLRRMLTCMRISLALFLVAAFLASAPSDWGTVTTFLFLLWFSFLPPSRLTRRWGLHTGILLSVGAALVAISVNAGNLSGLRDFARTTPNTSLTTTAGRKFENAVMVRAIEKGAVIRNLTDGKILFVPWSQVARLTEPSERVAPQLRACAYFGWLCSYKDFAAAPGKR